LNLSIILIVVGTIVVIFGIAIVLVAKKSNFAANETIDALPPAQSKEGTKQ